MRDKLKGNREERLKVILRLSETHRPQGRVMAIIESPNRDKEQMCLIREIEVKKGQKNKG